MRSSPKEAILGVEQILRRGQKTVPEIQQALLDHYGIIRERKSIYDDLAALTVFLPITKTRISRKVYWGLEGEK